MRSIGCCCHSPKVRGSASDSSVTSSTFGVDWMHEMWPSILAVTKPVSMTRSGGLSASRLQSRGCESPHANGP